MEKHSLIVGTIITSILNYDQLNDLLGENRGCHPDSTFAPCDGRIIDRNSKLGEILVSSGKLNVPDLRGKFVRGLNVMDVLNVPGEPFDNKKYGDPSENRSVGDYQLDAIIEHNHSYKIGNFQNNADGGTTRAYVGADFNQVLTSGGVQKVTTDGFETRPRNVSVYFYIKIN